MNIKNTFILNVAFISLAFLIFTFLIILFFQDYQQSLQKSQIAQNLSSMIFDRRSLAQDYIHNQSDRAKEQWFSKQNSLKEYLYTHQELFKNKLETESLGIIENSVTTSEQIFNQIIQHYQQDYANPLNAATLNRLTSQLSANAQQGVSAANHISNINNQLVDTNFTRILIFFSLASLVLLIVLVHSFIIIWHSANELHKQKAQVSAILEGIGDGVFVIDRSWNILLFNKAASLLSGYSQAEVIGKPLRSNLKFVSEIDRQEKLEFIERTMVSGQISFMTNHTILVRKDGTEIPIGDSAAPLTNDKGDLVGAIIIFRDLTKEREATSLKSDFAYASHQLRTPVTKALWNIEAVLSNKDLGNLSSSIEQAYLSIKSVKKLTDQIGEVSKIDQGVIIPRRQRFSLKEVVDETVRLVAQNRDVPHNIFTIHFFDNATHVITDPVLFKRILTELLDNAVIYSPTNTQINLTFSLHQNSLLIEVADKGIGINEENQATIFTKFFRGNNFNTTNIVGAGLGLYLCQKYVKILGGKIWFNSQENQGSVFSVLLPIS